MEEDKQEVTVVQSDTEEEKKTAILEIEKSANMEEEKTDPFK